jgi:hypothetical protein
MPTIDLRNINVSLDDLEDVDFQEALEWFTAQLNHESRRTYAESVSYIMEEIELSMEDLAKFKSADKPAYTHVEEFADMLRNQSTDVSLKLLNDVFEQLGMLAIQIHSDDGVIDLRQFVREWFWLKARGKSVEGNVPEVQIEHVAQAFEAILSLIEVK